MHKKLRNFPCVNILTIDGAQERQDLLNYSLDCWSIPRRWFTGYNIQDHEDIIVNQVSGLQKHDCNNMEIACSIGHLSMIKNWYENTNEPIGLFFEDDISLDCIEYWNFTWDEFVNSLPSQWNVVQLVLVKELPISNFRLQKRTKHNWSAAAYLLTRDYAAQLIDAYCRPNNYFDLTIPCNTDLIPTAENIVYQMAKPNDYTFPILTENVAVASNFSGVFFEEKVKTCNHFSEYQAKHWWEKVGSQLTIKELTSLSIPVIGTAVVNSSHWVSRLYMSIDYPVDHFVIINNNGRGELDTELEALKQIKHRYVKQIHIVNIPSNLGCSGAWNLIIKSFIIQPYWIIVNDDVAFGPGLLAEMASKYREDPTVSLIHPNSGDFNLGSFDLFLITENAIREFGLFDENFYPAYCEDADYIMRMLTRPHKKVIGLTKSYYHGPGTKEEYELYGSQTKKSEPKLTNKIIHSNLINWEYMTEKWSSGWRLCSPYPTPFDKKDIPITYTSYNIDYVRRKHLGF